MSANHGNDVEGLSLYIHVPFCLKKCYYCDFNSYPLVSHQVPDYIEALKKEMRDKAADLKNREVATIYIGGGTPTSLKAREIEEIIGPCFTYFSIAKNAEITVEANPGTLTREKLRTMRTFGINRLSLGAQTFNDKLLERIGRIHNSRQIATSLQMARRMGFENISLDLIFGLPGETLDMWMESLASVMALGPDHISTYNLVIEEGTRLHEELEAGLIEPISQELDLEMYTKARALLESAGYHQYEISNFAKEGKECRHNLVYWRNKEYLGIGSGAHSYFNGYRFSNLPGINGYIDGVRRGTYVAHRERIEEALAMWETIFLGLRLTGEGVDYALFEGRFARSLEEVYGPVIERLEGEGFLATEGGRLLLTEKGLPVANQVFIEFAP